MLNTRANRAPITRTASFTASAALLAVAMVVAGFTASAQTFSTVSGSVVDPQGALLPGVSVVLTNAQTEAKYEVRTATQLPAGRSVDGRRRILQPAAITARRNAAEAFR